MQLPVVMAISATWATGIGREGRFQSIHKWRCIRYYTLDYTAFQMFIMLIWPGEMHV